MFVALHRQASVWYYNANLAHILLTYLVIIQNDYSPSLTSRLVTVERSPYNQVIISAIWQTGWDVFHSSSCIALTHHHWGQLLSWNIQNILQTGKESRDKCTYAVCTSPHYKPHTWSPCWVTEGNFVMFSTAYTYTPTYIRHAHRETDLLHHTCPTLVWELKRGADTKKPNFNMRERERSWLMIM